MFLKVLQNVLALFLMCLQPSVPAVPTLSTAEGWVDLNRGGEQNTVMKIAEQVQKIKVWKIKTL
jgi:cupin superfamily acireductone dioxygenase involved in methionine salvage